MRISKCFSLPVLSGLLIGTSYIPFPPWASLFAFVPLWIFTLRNRDNWKLVALGAWTTGFTLTLVGFNWIALTIHEFGNMPWPVAILGLIAHCMVANVDIAVATSLWALWQKHRQPPQSKSLLVLVALTALFEAHFPSIFAWNYGYTFYWAKLPIYHLAELIGFQGLSSLVLLFNLAFLKLYLNSGSRLRRLALIFLAFLSLNLSGWGLEKSLPPPDAEMKIGLVQANIGNLMKQAAEHGSQFKNFIVNEYIELSRQLVATDGPLDFVVWPETAFPSTIFDTGYGDAHLEKLRTAIVEMNTAFVIGAYGIDLETQKPKNGIFAFEANGNFHPDHYFKTHLLAFGEYIPAVEIFPFLRKVIPAGEFARGHGPKVFDFNDHKIGLQICYESLFPIFSLGLAEQGAQWILNVTNDSWYGTWQEPYQHMTMTLARAVEVRRPLVRVTNTGISTVALASGKALEFSPLNEKWAKAYTVPYRSRPKSTFYQKWPWLMDAILLLVLLLGLSSRRKSDLS